MHLIEPRLSFRSDELQLEYREYEKKSYQCILLAVDNRIISTISLHEVSHFRPILTFQNKQCGLYPHFHQYII